MNMLAAEPAAGPPWLAIVLGVLAVLTAAATAYGPVLVEKAKQRKAAAEQEPAKPAVAPAADGALALVDEALDDLKSERDYWRNRATDCNDRALNSAVTIAKLEARVEALEVERERLIERFGRHGT